MQQDVSRLSGQVGAADRAKLDEYLESVRDVERRILQAEKATPDASLADYDRPSGIPASFEEDAKVMMDLQVPSQADLTRMITFMLGREVSARSYPQIGVPDAHHPLSHHGNDPAKVAKLTKINVLHMVPNGVLDEANEKRRKKYARCSTTPSSWAAPAWEIRIRTIIWICPFLSPGPRSRATAIWLSRKTRR